MGFFTFSFCRKRSKDRSGKKNSHRFPPASLCYSLLSLLVSFLPPWALASRLSFDPCEGRKAFPTRGRKRARECFFISFSFCLPFFFIVTIVVATSFSYFRPPTSDLRDTSTAMASTPAGCPVSESNLVDVTHLPRALQWLLAIAVVLISGFFAGDKGERERRRRT